MRSVTRSSPTFQSIFGMYPFRTRREVLSKQTVADSYFKNPDIPLLFTRDTSPSQNKFKQNLRRIVRVRNRNNDLKTNIPLKYEETHPNLYLNRHRLKQPGKYAQPCCFCFLNTDTKQTLYRKTRRIGYVEFCIPAQPCCFTFEYKHKAGPFCRRTRSAGSSDFVYPLHAGILFLLLSTSANRLDPEVFSLSEQKPFDVPTHARGQFYFRALNSRTNLVFLPQHTWGIKYFKYPNPYA